MMRESKSYEKHPTRQALYDALMQSLILDEADMEKDKVVDPLMQKKRLHEDKDQDAPAGSNQGIKKGKKTKDVEMTSSSKCTPQSQPKLTGKSVQAEETVFKAVVDDGPKQNWRNDLANVEKPHLTFDDLMSIPIDFSIFAMNHLKISKLTKADLVGPFYNLLKGTCTSYVELEYNIEECYRALSDQLNKNNPEG
nr:hypothetical protein [Tanacetum cinerariifolium]